MNNIIIISGSPGVGKSTIAKALHKKLKYTYVSKDYLKETLFENIDGVKDTIEYSRIIGGASMELLWVIASNSVNVILDSNFNPNSEYEIGKINSLKGNIIEIFCYAPIQTIQERFKNRALLSKHHPAHISKTISREEVEKYLNPIGIGKLIKVEINNELSIDYILEKLNKLLI